MAEIIYRGLKLSSEKCRYFQVIQGKTDSLYEDLDRSVLFLTYTQGTTTKSLSDLLGIQRLGKDMELLPMGLPKKFPNSIISLNGLKLRKLTYDPHVLHIAIVSDSESRVAQDYEYTTIVINENDYKDPEFIDFLFYSGNLQYLIPTGPRPKCYEIRNFPRYLLRDDSRELISDSETVYSLRRSHDDYVIRSIDYQDQVVTELRRILDEYGVEFVRINKETTLTKTSYISYQFMQTPTKIHHPGYSDPDDKIIHQRQPIEFVLRTTDMILFFDFKNKYNNVDLLTNFCEFKTTDKYGDRWTAAIKWGQITEDFNHTYQTDDNANLSFQCQFRCELFFYEAMDERYKFLGEITTNLDIEE